MFLYLIYILHGIQFTMFNRGLSHSDALEPALRSTVNTLVREAAYKAVISSDLVHWVSRNLPFFNKHNPYGIIIFQRLQSELLPVVCIIQRIFSNTTFAYWYQTYSWRYTEAVLILHNLLANLMSFRLQHVGLMCCYVIIEVCKAVQALTNVHSGTWEVL
jgi:hypothetical protein